MGGDVYGVNRDMTNADNDVHTFILTNNNDVKNFFEGKTKLATNTRSGDNSWGGRVTIGQPVTSPTTNTEFYLYEMIAFDRVLNDTEIFYIYDKIFA